MPDQFETLFNRAYGAEQKVADRLGSLIQESDPTDEVARQFGQLVERLTDARVERYRAPEDTDVQWRRKRPTFLDAAKKQLFQETPVEAWEIQRIRIHDRVLRQQNLKAMQKRVLEIRPAITNRLSESQPDLGGEDLDVAVRREMNKVLYAEGFGVMPVHKPEKFRRGLPGEALAGFVRGGLNIKRDVAAFYSDLLGQTADYLGHHEQARQFYASGAGARRRGESEAERFQPSEDLGEFDPADPQWWAARVGENVPQFGLMMGAGAAAGAVAKSIGAGAKATRAFQIVTTSGGIGSLEAASAYESSLDQLIESGLSLDDARGLASEQALVVGAVNALLESIAVGEFVAKIPGGRGRLIRAVRGAVIEGTTEGLQETTAIMGEMYAKAKASGGTTVQALAEMGRPVPEQIERILASFTIGAVIGAPVGGMTPTQRPGEAAPAAPLKEPAPELLTDVEVYPETAEPVTIKPEEAVSEAVPPTVPPVAPEAPTRPVGMWSDTAMAKLEAELAKPTLAAAPEAPVYQPGKLSQAELRPIREEMKARTYPANRVVHTTTLGALPNIIQQGVQPTETIDQDMAVSGSWTNAEGKVTGAALSYGGAGVPVVVVFKPTVEAPGEVGDTNVRSPDKSYVQTSDIEGVYVGADPQFYTLQEAVAVHAAPAVPPAPVETLPEQDSLESPEAAPMPGDGGTPLTTTLTDEVRRGLSDESGFWDPEVTGRAIAGGVTTVSEEAGTLLTGVSSLTDETVILRKTEPGSLIVEIVDSAVSQARQSIGKHMTAFHKAWKALSRGVRQWLVTVRDDGQTNHATLIEHPERITEPLLPGVQEFIAVERAMKEELGDAAVEAKLPQRKKDGSIGPFQKAESGRFFRVFTPEGQNALRFQKGPVWDALVQWLTDYAERNPGLPADEITLKEKLRGERKSGETRKQGSLEYTRTFDELPVALKVGGKWVMFQEGRPQNHFRSSLESQARRVTFWAEVQKRLLPIFGTFNEETGQMEAPHPSNPELVDVDGLVDSLRHRTAQAAKRPGAAQRAYDRILENYFREHRGGLMEEITLIVGESRLAGIVGAVDRNLMASILSFSGLWDILQPTAAAHIVGFKRLTRAYAKTIADILLHPQEYAAEYQSLGAVLDSFNDWSLRSDRIVRDLAGKNLPQAQMFLAEQMERMSQTITARAFDYWTDAINGKLKDQTARMLRKHLRLTDEEVLQVARGEMSPETRAKIIQNGVKTTNYLAEDPHRRGLLRNVSMLRWLIPFTSVMNGSFRAAGRVITDVVGDIQQVVQRKDPKAYRNLLRSSARLITFATLVFGRGFVQQYLRRLLTGRPLIDPEDPDEWWMITLEALGEGAMFGPYYRILEAGKYSGGDPERYVVNLIPRVAILLELATAIGGVGKYEGSTWANRLERAGLRFSPAGRTFRNWYDRLVWPERGEYKKLRSLVRVYNKERGITARYGTGPRHPFYYSIFEAIRDNNTVAAHEAVEDYKTWAKEQGWDSERARTGLRSSLQSRRPINLKKETATEFIESLAPGDQILAKRVQKRYTKLVNELTAREVIRRRAPRAKRAPRPAPTTGVDWYGTD